MTDKALLKTFCETVDKLELYSSSERLIPYLRLVFKDVDLVGKRMLDVGAGAGLCSFYAMCMGAGKVVALEPEGAGANGGDAGKFEKLSTALGTTSRIVLHSVTLQDYNPGDEKFDVILLHQSINHLDEEACIQLHRDPSAVETYELIFRRIHDLAADGARLVITDCSRHNFFGVLGVKNPFAPAIEWHKHQSPVLWIELLKRVGFDNPKLRWISLNRLGASGQLLLGNKVAAFFLRSYFCLTMQKA